jgi:two-component system, cell cycle sensor histidine kinase and response regulator CckA
VSVSGGDEDGEQDTAAGTPAFLAAVIDQVKVGIVASDSERRIRVWSKGTEELLGIPAEEALGRTLDDFEPALPSESREVRAAMKDLLASGGTWEGEIELRRRDGRSFTALVRNGPLRGEHGEPIGYAGMIVDVTDRKRFEQELRRRAMQQAAITALGRRALSGADIAGLLDEAVATVAEILDVELVKVLELDDAGHHFEVRAGVGWEPGTVGSATVPANDSHAALTLREETVIVADYAEETRFTPARILHDHRARSGVTALIEGNDRAYGVIGAHSRQPRDFSDDDAYFLQAVGNVLAAALARQRGERLEAQLQQARRLEAVGQLAGGIAHDFNNLLSVILNYTQFLEGETSDEQTLADLREIENAARRATDLTRQLLVFSRRDMAEAVRVDLGEVVRETEALLRRTIGEHVTLNTRVAAGSLPVELGPGQANQVLINLVVNARDALADGGTIEVEARETTVDAAFLPGDPGLAPGRYAVLTVADDGAGMPPEVAAQVFEPFFTTKPPGEGTGLGLATVYGIVDQAGGHIEVDSAEGRGTRVIVYLPLSANDEPVEGEGREPALPAGRGQAILVVEDEEAVRRMTCRTLEQNGYRAIGASGAKEALRAFAAEDGIDLVLTDVVMPDLSGKELVAALRERGSDVRAIYMSGYAGDVVARHGGLEDDVPLLQKPFAADELLRTIQDALDAQGP